MASRILARSKSLALAAALSRAGTDVAQPVAGARALSSLPRHPFAAGSPLGVGKVLGYEPRSQLGGTQVSPRWFSTVPSNESPTQKSQISETYKSGTAAEQSDAHKSRDKGTPKVVAFSPIEAAIAKPRTGPLTSESSKVRRSELATLVTFYMIPALLLSSRSCMSTSLLVGAVFHQIYMFHKEIFLDYVHHGTTRKWALIYFKILLLITAKDTLVYFDLV